MSYLSTNSWLTLRLTPFTVVPAAAVDRDYKKNEAQQHLTKFASERMIEAPCFRVSMPSSIDNILAYFIVKQNYHNRTHMEHHYHFRMHHCNTSVLVYL